VLIVWPKNAQTTPKVSMIVSPQTGMIGHPECQASQIVVRTLFSPAFALGRPGITALVRSQLGAANNAMLTLTNVTHDLASEMPGGPWETTMIGTPQN
jgi:hypothetical protein